MIIDIEKATLRPPETRDADDVYRLFSDFEIVSRLRPIPWPADRAWCNQFNQNSLAKWAEPDNHSKCWVIDMDGAHCGMIHAGHQEGLEGTVFSLGYWLDRRQWRKGIMSDAVQAVTHHCFDALEATGLIAGVLADNPASGHILQKQGFSIIGVEDTHFTALDQIRPYVRYRLLREEWEARQ